MDCEKWKSMTNKTDLLYVVQDRMCIQLQKRQFLAQETFHF
jgi:hypothetical protein